MSSTALVPQTKQNLSAVRKPQARYLVQSIKLEEAGPPAALTFAMVVIGVLLVAGIFWAMITQVNEVASANGNVVPAGAIYSVQHLEGGVVREVNVRDGQLVDQGDVLMRLAPETAGGADLAQLRARLASLTLQIERLQAVIEGRDPAFEAVLSDLGDLSGIQDLQSIVTNQRELYLSTRENETRQADVLRDQIAQQQAELNRLTALQESQEEEVALLEEQLGIRQELANRGLAARLTVIETERDYNRALGSLQETADNLARTQSALDEVETRLAELESRLRSEALDQLSTARSERAEVLEQLTGVSERVRRLDLVAPVRGLVQGMEVSNVGAVVQPGQLVMEIVPVGDDLEVEARVNPRDRGHIEVGQPAEVRVSSYDFARFGSVPATLDRISPSTFLDENQQPYYQVFLSLDRSHVGPDPSLNPILPGMTVQADIRTGSKKVIDYLLRPIIRGFSNAFDER